MAELAAMAVSAITSATVPTIISTVATVGGLAVSAAGARQQGKDAQAMANYQAQQLEQKAGQDRATAQRRSIEDRRQASLAMSRVQAVAGGGGADPSILGLTGDIAGEGEYNALASLYEGEERAIGREMQATGARAEGDAARSASRYKVASNILQGASTFSKYWGGTGPTGSVGDGLSQGDRRKIGVY